MTNSSDSSVATQSIPTPPFQPSSDKAASSSSAPAQPTFTGIPSLQTHIADTWKRFTSSILNVFLISLFSFVASIVTLGVVIGGIFGLGASTINFSQFSSLMEQKNFAEAFALIPSSFYMGLGIGILALIVVSSILQAAMTIATILAVGWSENKPSVGSLLKEGFKNCGWFIVLSLINFLLVFGSFWVFIIGGIVTSTFVSFAIYELTLNKKGPLAALRDSATLVAENFGVIFGRYIIFILAYIIIFALIPEFFRAISSSLAATYSLFTGILSLFMGSIGLCYTIVLYEYIRKATPESKNRSGLWVGLILTSVVGWLIFFIAGAAVVSGLKTLMNKEMAKELSPSSNEMIMNDTIELPASDTAPLNDYQ